MAITEYTLWMNCRRESTIYEGERGGWGKCFGEGNMLEIYIHMYIDAEFWKLRTSPLAPQMEKFSIIGLKYLPICEG